MRTTAEADGEIRYQLNRFKPQVLITDRSKAVLLLWFSVLNITGVSFDGVLTVYADIN